MNRKFFTSLAAAGLLACTVISAQAAPVLQETGIGYIQRAEAGSALETEAYKLVNRQRKAHGLAPLAADFSLGALARIKSQDMAANGYFDHTSPTYGSPFTMMKSLGVSYTSAGENIAKGYRSAAEVVAAWMASDSHRANILSERYTAMGIGYSNGCWTQWLIG